MVEQVVHDDSTALLLQLEGPRTLIIGGMCHCLIKAGWVRLLLGCWEARCMIVRDE